MERKRMRKKENKLRTIEKRRGERRRGGIKREGERRGKRSWRDRTTLTL